ncbi:hypothetical protein AgCh_023148 [Apium graveolens]
MSYRSLWHDKESGDAPISPASYSGGGLVAIVSPDGARWYREPREDSIKKVMKEVDGKCRAKCRNVVGFLQEMGLAENEKEEWTFGVPCVRVSTEEMASCSGVSRDGDLDVLDDLSDQGRLGRMALFDYEDFFYLLSLFAWAAGLAKWLVHIKRYPCWVAAARLKEVVVQWSKRKPMRSEEALAEKAKGRVRSPKRSLSNS